MSTRARCFRPMVLNVLYVNRLLLFQCNSGAFDCLVTQHDLYERYCLSSDSAMNRSFHGSSDLAPKKSMCLRSADTQ